jgi:hypothetical protein
VTVKSSDTIIKDSQFGTAINCIDGRVQLPVSNWLKERYSVSYVDTITAPGVDKIFSETNVDKIEQLKSNVMVSINAHESGIVAIAGHHGCAGNPVTKVEHLNHIRKALEIIKSWNLPVKVVGLWINENWEVELA